MAYIAREMFRKDFISDDLVIVPHNLDLEYIDIRLLIDNIARQDLIKEILVDESDPKNRLAVAIRSSQTGTIQVLETDIVQSGRLSATQMAALGLSDNFNFGENYHYAESLSESSTMSLTPVSKLLLTTTSVPAGDYHVGWNFTWHHDNDTTDFIGVAEIDGAPVYTVQQEPKNNASTERYQAHGFVEKTLSAASHTVNIKFATTTGTHTSYISQARIELWRVK